ncbi:MFS transporter [Congregibacter variabilis]|uniref:MFS transporter n=1 Tax=Congregibacter variabilis TaxID=3081200 RepID=A0ABZ0HZK9_9GAMM|nr:MFS transporter [Congregibacter sp. IMCC43200]
MPLNNPPPRQLGTREVVLLAAAGAIVTANAYYIHPIIGSVADSFDVSYGLVGLVPALNQIALALGVLFLLPLGDRMSNRRLAIMCIAAQVASLVCMATVQDFRIFVAASSALGFFTITPYLLPAYTSKRVPKERLGFVTAVLTTGVIAGVQLSRVTSGAMGEILGWRSVYWMAAGAMALSMIVLPMLMDTDEPPGEADRQSYGRLLNSLFTLASKHPRIMVSGIIQGLGFSAFLSCWLGIGLHLTSSELNLGTDTVGYLAAFSAVGLLVTPRLGHWADRFGAEKARFRMATINLLGILTLGLASYHWLFLILPILVMSTVGPMVDVTGRMTSLNTPPPVRTRLMTVYITLMFLGGGMGSWTGTIAYDLGGWWGTVALTSCFAALVCILSWQQARGR